MRKVHRSDFVFAGLCNGDLLPELHLSFTAMFPQSALDIARAKLVFQPKVFVFLLSVLKRNEQTAMADKTLLFWRN